MPTYHVYRNGTLSPLTVPPASSPMWPGTPIEPDSLAATPLARLLPDEEPQTVDPYPNQD